ncbi:acyltransferase family protein [Paenibacillus plantarum]|nr:acyltransferase [Paenibacillus plantarum]
MDSGKRLDFLEILRVLAVLFVIWDHMVANWLDRNKQVWLPLNIIREYVTKPLAIIQDFGFLGVVIFFLISGYIISYVMQKEGRLSFLVKRIFRIYPPLIFSIIIIVIFYKLQAHFTNQVIDISQFSISKILISMTLINYLFIEQNATNGVAWTLVIEMLFYILCFIILPLIQKYPKLAISTLTLIPFIVIFESKNFGANFFLFSASIAYLPYLVLGQILYFVYTKRISIVVFLIFSVVNYIVIIYGIRKIHNSFYDFSSSYGVSFVYAYLIFVLAVMLQRKIYSIKITDFLAKLSYSLYLNHGVLGSFLITLCYPYIGFSGAITVSFVCIIILCCILWKFVEEPSRHIARKLLNVYVNQK